ncbi:DUF3467 domain-containing protein [Candidatus Woesearchaeota archaeon]|nr:DUF3467 domain-containing protein [Candidatus Woesearchaeota archaeon]
MEKKINLSINEGTAFFAHEASINFGPTQVIMDFRCITPRVDPRSNEAPTLNMAHNVIMVEPYHAKRLFELLGTTIEKYEKEFGKIEKSKAMKSAEKKRKEMKKDPQVSPSYFG